jgi:hypothetical protein
VQREALEDLHAELEGLAVVGLERLAEARHGRATCWARRAACPPAPRIVGGHREAEIEAVAALSLPLAWTTSPTSR